MTIRIETDLNQMTQAILKALRDKVNDALFASAPLIEADLKGMIDGVLQGTSTYKSLLNGDLRGDFGLFDPRNNLKDILEKIKDSVKVHVTPLVLSGVRLRGGLEFYLIKDDFQDILSLSSAAFDRPDGFRVDWLNWLLLQGDRIIVMGHHVDFNIPQHQKKFSTSGLALMKPGGTWRVPPFFAGTINDNWITKSFNVPQVEKTIEYIIEKNITRTLT